MECCRIAVYILETMSWTRLRSILLSLTILASGLPASGQQASPPEKLQDGIDTGTLRAAGLDERTIIAGTKEITNGSYPNIHSLLIFRRGRLVYENYFTGADVERGVGSLGIVNHTRDTLHDVRSVTKSIVGIAVLIADSQGKIKSLDEPIFSFFPEYKDHATGDKKKITVKHVLSMTSGLEWNEEIPYTDPTNSEIQMNNSLNAVEFVLSRQLVEKPGLVFNYSGGMAQLLAALIKKSTGMDADLYTEKHLFQPLGIEKYKWVKTKSGDPSAASGLRLRSRDIGKIALVLMNNGKWNGKVIIPKKLVEAATTEHAKVDLKDAEEGDRMGYGYQIWKFSFLIGDEPVSLIEFTGNGGQQVEIDLKNQLVVVVTAGNYDKYDLKKGSWDIYPDIVYPALLDRKSRKTKPNKTR